MAAPRVSIGLTVEDGAAHLETAIDSLLGQTFRDFELIISDDGSTDRTQSICRSYAARDPRIRYYREEEKRGPIWSSNRVFELSCGAYFKWATFDDVCGPTFLARCVELLDSDPSIAWCHTTSRHMDQAGKVVAACDDPAIPEGRCAHSLIVEGPHPPRPTRRSARPHERLYGVLLGPNWCSDGYGLIRSDVLRRTRLLRPCYGPGKVLIAEICLQGRFEEVPETLFFERIRPHTSGTVTTEAQRYALIHPATASRFSSTRLKLLWEYVQAIRCTDLPAVEKGRCFAVVVRYLFQAGKWRRILGGDFTGGAMEDLAGTGPRNGDRAPQHTDAATTRCEPVSTR